MSSFTKAYFLLIALVCMWTCCSGNFVFTHLFFRPTEAGYQFQELDKHLVNALPNDNNPQTNINAAAKLLEPEAQKKSSLSRLLKRKDKNVSIDRAVESLITLNAAKSCTTELLHAIGFIFKGLNIGSDDRKSGMEGLTRINKIVNQLLTDDLMNDCRKSLEQLRQKLRAELGDDKSVATLEQEIKLELPGYQAKGPSKKQLAFVLFKLSKESGMVLAQTRTINGKLVEVRDVEKLLEAAKKFFLEPCEKVVATFGGLFTVVYELKSKYSKEEAFYNQYPSQLVQTEFIYNGCRFVDRYLRGDFKESVFEHFLANN